MSSLLSHVVKNMLAQRTAEIKASTQGHKGGRETGRAKHWEPCVLLSAHNQNPTLSVLTHHIIVPLFTNLPLNRCIDKV